MTGRRSTGLGYRFMNVNSMKPFTPGTVAKQTEAEI